MGVQLNKVLLVFVFCIFIFSCSETEKKIDLRLASNKGKWLKPKYATGFVIFSSDDYTICYLLNKADTLARYVLTKKNQSKNSISIPCNNAISMSSIYSYMMYRLEESDRISGVDNLDYICNQNLREKLIKNQVVELAKSFTWDVEKIVKCNTKVIFTWGSSSTQSVSVPDVIREKFSIVYLNDHLETHPLGRAEWIKFLSCFFDKYALADSLFSETEKKYLDLKSGNDETIKKPTVLTEIKLAEGWFLPGGKSSMAKLIEDAGGKYLWSDNAQSGSLCLNFEEVYRKAKDVDYWINLPLVTSKTDLLNQDQRYGFFAAYKNSNMFNNDSKLNEKGGNAFWEEGIVCPDKILKDLQLIFSAKDLLSDSLYFYRRLK